MALDKAYIVTDPTAGIGRRAALELARHGTVVLVGRDRAELDEVRKAIEDDGGRCSPRGRRPARSAPTSAPRTSCTPSPTLCQPVPGEGPAYGRRMVAVLVDGLRTRS